MLQKAKNKKGMTMIEVTLVIAMVSVAMLMAMNLINGTSKDKDVMEKIYAERQNYISMVSKTLHELKYPKNPAKIQKNPKKSRKCTGKRQKKMPFWGIKIKNWCDFFVPELFIYGA